jgi:hypothetical protein
MNRPVLVLDPTHGHGRREGVVETVCEAEFLTKAACAALTGLLANPTAHEEKIRWDDLSREAWEIALEMARCAPDGVVVSEQH